MHLKESLPCLAFAGPLKDRFDSGDPMAFAAMILCCKQIEQPDYVIDKNTETACARLVPIYNHRKAMLSLSRLDNPAMGSPIECLMSPKPVEEAEPLVS